MSGHMVVTPSEDGVPRASIRIEYRIGLSDLAQGILWELEQRYDNLCELSPLARTIACMSRDGVYTATRSMLQERGALYGEGAGERCHRQTIDLAAAKARKLFPEFS